MNNSAYLTKTDFPQYGICQQLSPILQTRIIPRLKNTVAKIMIKHYSTHDWLNISLNILFTHFSIL